MQVKSIAECSKHSAILSTFIKLPFVVKSFVLYIFGSSLTQMLLYIDTLVFPGHTQLFFNLFAEDDKTRGLRVLLLHFLFTK